MNSYFERYSEKLRYVLETTNWDNVEKLAYDMRQVWDSGGQLFLCGNGGSAGNAIHLANDFLYGVGKDDRPGIRVEALTGNQAVLTCLANNYGEIFSQQLRVKAIENDLLMVLSGSGNSKNVIRALEVAKEMDIKSYAILGFDGGKCKNLADVPIHFPVADMQISEDLQLVVGHMCMQWLASNQSV